MNKRNRVLIVFNKYKQLGGEQITIENEFDYLQNFYETKLLSFKNNFGPSVLWSSFNLFSFLKTFYTVLTYRPKVLYINNLWFKASNAPLVAAFLFKNIDVYIKIHNYRLSCANSLHYRESIQCIECSVRNKSNSYKYKCYKNSLIMTYLVNKFSQFQFYLLAKRNVKKIFVLNNFQKELMVEAGLDKNKIFLTKNIVKIKPRDRGQNNIHNKFYFVGRYVEEKGILDLISAWKELDTSNFELHLIGQGPLNSFIDREISNFKNIINHGSVSNQEIQTKIEDARALIFPTRLLEGQPTVILESMQQKIPVLSPKIPFIDSFSNNLDIETFELCSVSDLKKLINLYFDESFYQEQKNLWNKFSEDFFRNLPEF